MYGKKVRLIKTFVKAPNSHKIMVEILFQSNFSTSLLWTLGTIKVVWCMLFAGVITGTS